MWQGSTCLLCSRKTGRPYPCPNPQEFLDLCFIPLIFGGSQVGYTCGIPMDSEVYPKSCTDLTCVYCDALDQLETVLEGEFTETERRDESAGDRSLSPSLWDQIPLYISKGDWSNRLGRSRQRLGHMKILSRAYSAKRVQCRSGAASSRCWSAAVRYCSNAFASRPQRAIHRWSPHRETMSALRF